MATEIILPKVDMDMATGKISKWYFKEGDRVGKGDVLFEIETDKAAMEIDSPATGILRNVTGEEGIDIAVGSAVAWVYEEGEEYQAAPELSPPTASGTVEASDATTANPVAQNHNVSADAGSAIRATPLARRLAREGGIDLGSVAGTGPYGRIVSADVSKARVAEATVALPAPTGAENIGQQGSSDGSLKLFPEGTFDLQPHTPMRRTIARRLLEAKTTIPHFYLSVDCHIDALLKLRTELNESAPVADGTPKYKLSVNDMVIKAYALALGSTPDANVSWTEENLLRHHSVDVGVAVSVAGGLITPIIRHAESKTLSTISNEMKDLAARARSGKLKPVEYQGGTGAISNLGMFGVKEFAAIINPPHSTILAVGSGEKRPVVNAHGDLSSATVMTVTLSTDHRAVDGALGAELIGKFRTLIENPMSMLI
ncbi:pyruvate dehydrogenase complex dihydrolipoamide acetyltransferase [Rhizobium leguminosarum]|uniref:pyruvate dehydrogenase complex dihydrolipoamide acetyltransferase n=1 Tax=Rhizobium leguminosarum TaxID=384 RepID=UPI000990311D|nr:pyruvate dehydrogenase complex dihydrolipoamide acetyltransferase [Rhizobium leguminosarum]ASS58043.1 pyruvate dehydrogenase complex dihydrolipoamide acetyltransferase [Rhizobium leguminosarum bv. viciae]MBB4329967.1 pyruvate dehydrogenase E2 component (dihydrolipoamide acetyltransferase) [Rhizobium leguminosarum]MBB4355362.1 pyruvate dehydrogenase E2 component (dihydrolipoamide acetyltransferase) [Rhizobium leguminosarum]MBB4389971.1 pyruvate dehydrogenase E2 component (dihydrolipoamide ace